MSRAAMRVAPTVVVALVAFACGGHSPSGPSTKPMGVSIKGTLVTATASSTVSSSDQTPSGTEPVACSSPAPKPKVTVRIDGTTNTTEVSPNGTFELENVPGGSFTLVFESNGKLLGTVSVSAPAGATVKIVIRVQGNTIVIVDMQILNPDGGAPEASKYCPIEGGRQGAGIELEGDVSWGDWVEFGMDLGGRSKEPVTVKSSAASFVCNGEKKTLTPEQCKKTVTPRAQVHVRGLLTACDSRTPNPPTVTASEVKVQKAVN